MPAIIASLEEQGMKAVDASENEMAKSHCRYLVRGGGVRPESERFFRFSFPERPGALKHFLETLPNDINGARFIL
jgi:threonine dehydratase